MSLASRVLVYAAVFLVVITVAVLVIMGLYFLATSPPYVTMLVILTLLALAVSFWIYTTIDGDQISYRFEDFLREKVSQSNDWLARSRQKKGEGVVRRPLRRSVR